MEVLYLQVEFKSGKWLVIEMAPTREMTPEERDADAQGFVNQLEGVVRWTWVSPEEGRGYVLSGILTTWPLVHMAWQTGGCTPLYGEPN